MIGSPLVLYWRVRAAIGSRSRSQAAVLRRQLAEAVADRERLAVELEGERARRVLWGIAWEGGGTAKT